MNLSKFNASADEHGHSDAHPVAPPIFQTATFWSPDSDTFLEMATTPRHAAFYTRYGNPTIRSLEDAVAQFEGAEAALATASGMSAIVAAILAFATPRAHMVAQRMLYGGTTGFLQTIAPRLGLEIDFFDQDNLEDFANKLRPETRLVLLETPSNPLLRLTDISAVAARVKAVSKALILVDSTIATPINQQPLRFGADLVMHSMTKSIGGHSDVSGGVLAGSLEHITSVWQTAYLLGATLDPFAAWLALRGIRTLAMRVARHNQTANEVAVRLLKSKKIKAVHYPGLESHPQHDLAKRQMRNGAGGVLSFEVEGGVTAAERVMAHLRVAQRAASFGSYSTLAVHPAAMWAGMMSEQQLHETGLPSGLIRMGVGFEEPDLIIADIEAALSNI